MNKSELILEIINLYDENTRLKNENERLKEDISVYKNIDISADEQPNKNIKTHTDVVLIREGKKAILDNVIYSWKLPYCEYKSETDTYNVTSYKGWLREALNIEKIPRELSLEEFELIFYQDLQKMYEEKKEKAIAERKEKQND